MLGLSTRSYSVTVDASQQKIYFVPRRSLFTIAVPWVVSFEEIEQVHLGSGEQCYDIPAEYGTEQRMKRRWSVELILRDGQTVTAAEETTDHRAGETTVLAQQHARWESLAKSVGELVGKPLMLGPTVPDGPHTFIQVIEHILQRRIRQSGLNNLSVHLRNGKDLGVEIVVNGKLYASVDEVEDEAVRSLIRASIHEWQNGNR